VISALLVYRKVSPTHSRASGAAAGNGAQEILSCQEAGT